MKLLAYATLCISYTSLGIASFLIISHDSSVDVSVDSYIFHTFMLSFVVLPATYFMVVLRKKDARIEKLLLSCFMLPYLLGSVWLIVQLFYMGTRSNERGLLKVIYGGIQVYCEKEQTQMLPSTLAELTSPNPNYGNRYIPLAQKLLCPHSGMTPSYDDLRKGKVDFVYTGNGKEIGKARSIILHSRPEFLNGWVNVLFSNGDIATIRIEGDLSKEFKKRGWAYKTQPQPSPNPKKLGSG